MADLVEGGSTRRRADRTVMMKPPRNGTTLPILRPSVADNVPNLNLAPAYASASDAPAAIAINGSPLRRDDVANAEEAVVDAAIVAGDLTTATVKTLDLLACLPSQHLGTAQAAARLIVAYQTVVDGLPPLYQVARHKIHFDDRAAVCFEQMVALLRHQNSQIAELQAIVEDLV